MRPARVVGIGVQVVTRVVVDANGYVRIGRETYLHRVVAETALGRALRGRECVHHVNADRADNQNNNLVICPNQSYHLLLHARQRILQAGGHPDKDKICGSCLRVLPKDKFSFNKRTWDGRFGSCRSCSNERRLGKGYSKWSPLRAEQQRLRRAK